MGFSKAELERMVASVPHWWHSIDVGQGVVTPGRVSHEWLNRMLDNLRLPDLHGKRVLDIGAYDGFFSFAVEKRGAAQVIALDYYVWSMDLVKQVQLWKECQEKGVPMPPEPEVAEVWQPERLPGKQAFDTVHNALDSRVEPLVANFLEVDLDRLGTFDVVLFLGVLYHMEDPLGCMRRVARLTKDLAVIETEAIEVPGSSDHALCEFYPFSELNGDSSNWWAPNEKALVALCQAAGFSKVDVLVGPPEGAKRLPSPPSRLRSRIKALVRPPRETKPEVQHYRLIAQARK
jgi:tRNA (mo5U34)-methyltransferase